MTFEPLQTRSLAVEVLKPSIDSNPDRFRRSRSGDERIERLPAEENAELR